MSKPQNQNLQKLAYRIISCSSEEPSNPVQELLTQSPQSKGWQSARFCDYPQEIVMQFMSPVRLKQIQFLSHQSKISSRIEIYVYMPNHNAPFINTDIKYKKLGYLSLDSNERTGYQSRELKTVYVDSPSLYLKLIFHKQHNNKYNMFNQVGIIALSTFGELLTNVQQNPGNNQQQKEYYNQIQYQTQFDAITLDRLRTLENAKEKAVQNEDFEEAKRLKEAIERLKQIGTQLRQLDERKQIAIQNEDYESAKIIKAEIDRLRNAIAPEYILQKPAPLNYQQQPVQKNIQQYQQLQQQQQQPFENQFEPISQPSQNLLEKKQEQHIEKKNLKKQLFDDMPVKEQQQHEENDEKSYQDNLQQKQMEEQYFIKNKNIANHNHDEQVVPAVKNTANKKPWELEDAYEPNSKFKKENINNEQLNNQQQQQGEKLTNEARKLADPFISVIGEDYASKIFSKVWKAREDGLKELEQELQAPKTLLTNDPQAIFTAICGICSTTLGDRVAQVLQASMSILQEACKSRNCQPKTLKGDTQQYLDSCVGLLIEQLGQHIPKISEMAQQSLFSLGSVSVIGNAFVVNGICKGVGLKQKLQNSIKHIQGRLVTLQEFVRKFQIGNKEVPLNPVVEFAIKQLSHANQDVRNTSIALLVEIHRCVGEAKLTPFLSEVPQQQMDILIDEFQRGGTGGKAQVEKKQEKQQKVVVQTNIQHQGPGKANANKKNENQANVNNSNEKKKKNKADNNNSIIHEKEKNTICDFCGVHNENFAENQNLDIHQWKECPMLMICKYCAQVVEISSLGQHLLEECAQMRKFRKCPRCKEPVHVDEYNNHVDEKSCLPAKPLAVANRCVLCHTDIPPGQQGWKIHLTVDGCPNNERSVG